MHKTRNGLNKKNRLGAKGWKSIDLYRICSLEGLKSGVTVISYVVSTLYQLLYQRCFLVRSNPHHTSLKRALSITPPSFFYLGKRGDDIFKIDKITKNTDMRL